MRRAHNEPKSAPTIAINNIGKTATGFSNTLKFQSREAREGSHNKWSLKKPHPSWAIRRSSPKPFTGATDCTDT
jgi:hypothetical protein